MKSDVDDTRTPSVILLEFFETLPFKDRTTVSLVLTQIRNNLDDVIPNTNPISWFVGKIKQLQLVFMKIPLVLRKQMKTLLLEGLESSLEVSNPLLCIFTLCLCLSELSAFRNCDRSDLESEDIWTTLQVLNSSVFPKLRGRIKEQKTNLPSLLSWSYCMLAFTYHSCVEWIQQQFCKPSSSFCVRTSVAFDSTVLDHPTVPILMRHILQAQIKNEPYIIPQAPHTLLDLLFSSAISSNAGILKSCKVRKPHDPAECFIEYDEPPVQLIKDDKKSNCILKRKLALPSSFQHTLQTDSFEDILSDLSLLKQLLGNASQQKWLLENLIFTLRQTPFILKRLRCCVTNNSKSNDKNIHLYEQIYCLLLQLWFRAAVDRVLLKNFPQSYVWLCGFTRPLYEVMSIKGFSEVILWTGRFLAAYENLFRSSILNSPHWYLQMITDAVVAIIDKSEKGNQESISVDELDEILCTCMAAIIRPLHALRIEDHETHPEISRVIKVPLESVVSHISCRSVKKEDSATQKKNKKAKSIETASTPAISPRLRDLIVHHLILPMIRVCDKWALGQAKIGIKPHCAKALLNQLVSEAEAHYANSEGPNIAQKLDIVKPPAIGGLHVTEKLSLKRKR